MTDTVGWRRRGLASLLLSEEEALAPKLHPIVIFFFFFFVFFILRCSSKPGGEETQHVASLNTTSLPCAATKKSAEEKLRVRRR